MSIIENGLRADIFRNRIEDKNSFLNEDKQTSNKNLIYVSTGNVTKINDGTKDIYVPITEGKNIQQVISNDMILNGIKFSQSDIANGENAISIGFSASAPKTEAISIGKNANANANISISIGSGSYVIHPDVSYHVGSIAIGPDAHVYKSSGSIAIGSGANVQQAGNSIALGTESQVYSDLGISIGCQTYCQSMGGIAIGMKANITTNATDGIAIGNDAHSSAKNAVQIGTGRNEEIGSLKFGNGEINKTIVDSDGLIVADKSFALCAIDPENGVRSDLLVGEIKRVLGFKSYFVSPPSGLLLNLGKNNNRFSAVYSKSVYADEVISDKIPLKMKEATISNNMVIPPVSGVYFVSFTYNDVKRSVSGIIDTSGEKMPGGFVGETIPIAFGKEGIAPMDTSNTTLTSCFYFPIKF